MLPSSYIVQVTRKDQLIGFISALVYLFSCKSFLELTRDIANRMIYQYNKDGEFLPRTLRNSRLKIIARDNIDQNSKSTTATRHYHGTSLSIFSFQQKRTRTSKQIYKTHPTNHLWKSMHFHLFTHALKTSLPYCKH